MIYRLTKSIFTLLHKILPNRLIHPISNRLAKIIKRPIDKIKKLKNIVPEGYDIVFIPIINCDFSEKGYENMETLFEKYDITPTLAITEKELPHDIIEGADLASHSVHHDQIYLPSMNKDKQLEEIGLSLLQFYQCTMKVPHGFIAPYSAYNKDTYKVLQGLKFEWIAQNNSWYPRKIGNLLDLPRSVNNSESHINEWYKRLEECIKAQGIFCTYWHCFKMEDIKLYEEFIKHIISNKRIKIMSAIEYTGWFNGQSH